MIKSIRRQFPTIPQEGVSIIICCYNAQDRIVRTLEHIQQQRFFIPIPWEVIVIDNASTDNTAEVAENVWKTNPVTDFKI